ncbi:lysine decarboxylase-like protein [Aspergillus sergii]|uniref:Lysine decarboxylase-like protein n=1 Tax=Aspergillus sergii TaxID=1034303 RepID=A0A5N6WT76_9EURO|nr:lysine decarboxylase-like protein [Aspergillus sergii]
MTSNVAEQPVICVFCGAQTGEPPDYMAAARALALELHKSNAKLIYGGGTKGLMGEVAKTLVSLSGPSAVHGFIPKALIAYYPDANASRADEAEDGKQPERWVSADAPLKDHLGPSPLGSQYGKLTVVENMHERKRKMAEQVFAGGPGSGFVALPGGYGTLEEIAEITTWNQLGIHDKGIVLLNVDGFWDGLVGWIRTAARQKFVAEANKEILVECNKVDEVMGALKAYKPSSGRLSLSWNLK